ncbi:MAG: cytochrome c biogenesis protein DipZ [Candidatus Omnitrophica bacterium]|nr:cytochrome c biogenesis protein DipZ [Candidatus Omnitrophota bacterium]
MATLLVFAFLAGFITILAPCIWPLLPIVFSVSSGGGKRRSLGLTLGVIGSFTLFTLFISYIIRIFPVNPSALRLIAAVVIALLGLSMLVPPLGARFEAFINSLLGPWQRRFKKEGSGFGAGLVTGFSLGLVWAPCAGPILATIAALSATQAVNGRVLGVTLAYVLGLSIPLYIFSSLSAGWFGKMRAVNKYTGLIQQVFGAVVIVAAILIYTNYAQLLQARVLDLFPGYSRFLGQFENNARLQKELDRLAGREKSAHESGEKLLNDLGPAPDFAAISRWLNVPAPLTMKDLRGKVVLVDFWTYSCINCVRTLPHLKSWWQRYKNDGLVIVGVHTPEFAFERETQNVARALKQFGITYPVAQDNDYRTWSNYHNRYWPAEYLIDAKGHVRRVHFGEGHYDQTEEAIRALLKESGRTVGGSLTSVKDRTPRFDRTPETYLGSGRMARFVSPEEVQAGARVYSLPPEIPLDHFAYQGVWDVQGQSAAAGSGAALEFKVRARKIFLVAGPAKAGNKIKVLVDGKPQTDIILDSQRLYEVTGFKNVSEHLLQLGFPDKGTKVYAFTFG